MTRYLVPFLFFPLLGCSPAGPQVTDLDYAEVRDPSGWRLRIRGDGSASLHYAQLPAYHLHYPAGMFDAAPARRLACHVGDHHAVLTGETTEVSFYTALDDHLCTRVRAPSQWTREVLDQAFAQMNRAVETGSSERSCRMFRRVVLRGQR